MTTTKPRPSLADRFAKKTSAPEPQQVIEVQPGPPSPSGELKDKRVQILVRMTTAERKSLRRIALEQDTTVQALVEDAIRDVLRRHAS